MAGGFSEILDELDQAMLDNYNEYVMTALGAWESVDGNDGQMAIISRHILAAVADHVKSAKDEWPMGDGPDDYLDAVYGAFDPEVIDRAFSETLGESYDSLSELYEESIDLEGHHDALIGNGPHSTEPVWR